jgi:osmotically-inducible protein OsmY
MRSNAEIKKDIEAELRSSPDVNDADIAIQVNGGEVTLSGSVDSYLSKYRAEIATRRIIGVTAVANDIRVAPLAGSPADALAPDNIKHRIEEAFRCLAQVDADRIVVDTEGSEVLLRGEVRSWSERDQAQRSAWSAPGVTAVKNELTVRS